MRRLAPQRRFSRCVTRFRRSRSSRARSASGRALVGNQELIDRSSPRSTPSERTRAARGARPQLRASALQRLDHDERPACATAAERFALRRSPRRESVPSDRALRVRRRRAAGARAAWSVRSARVQRLAGWRYETASTGHGNARRQLPSCLRGRARRVGEVHRTARGATTARPARRRTRCLSCRRPAVRPGMVMVNETGELRDRGVGRAHCRSKPSGLRPRRRANAQLRRQRHRHAQLDLRLPRRRHPQHPRLRARLPRHAHDRARAELPLDELDPARREQRHREQPRAQAEAPVLGSRRGRSCGGDRSRGRARGGALRRRARRGARRGGLLRQRDRGLLPDERAVARARGRARAAGRRVPGDRRPALLRARRDQGPDRVPAGARQPRGRRVADAHREQAAPRHRRLVDRAPRRRSPTRRGSGCGTRWRARTRRASAPRRSRTCGRSTRCCSRSPRRRRS